MRGWTVLSGLMLITTGAFAQEVDEATLEARMEAFQESFNPVVRQWESFTSRGELLWTTGYFESMGEGEIVVFRVAPFDLLDRARKGESLSQRPEWNAKTPPPVFAFPLAGNAVFVSPEGRVLSRENLKLARDQILALGENPETGEVVEVVVLDGTTLQRLSETYTSRLRERLPAQE